jgi:hypothetical protein
VQRTVSRMYAWQGNPVIAGHLPWYLRNWNGGHGCKLVFGGTGREGRAVTVGAAE